MTYRDWHAKLPASSELVGHARCRGHLSEFALRKKCSTSVIAAIVQLPVADSMAARRVAAVTMPLGSSPRSSVQARQRHPVCLFFNVILPRTLLATWPVCRTFSCCCELVSGKVKLPPASGLEKSDQRQRRRRAESRPLSR